ncbi:PAS/PAC sensor signal transduction histidine kinase [Rivularia sp. PCC 7116]|uniref:PAS domain-containing sensor histidine kinase n=1 Tax=Rivularia sp. PCC 7116 TaxID=373994 RepID=UPI00029EE76E|nr:PAS domain-containing sensor histidine kinase [Rivularia sp. PCC 7116]AFY55229.1 PAS/PAC sensor signal transduction histidine kinase [Rivularia sp. PCC 7116]
MNQSYYPAENNNITQTEARFRRIIQATTQLVFFADADGRIAHFNQQWYQVTGLSESQSLGLNFICAVHESERDEFYESWLSAVKACESWEYEFRIIHKDKKAYWYVASAQPCFDEKQQVIEWVIVCHNINNYKEKEIALERRNEFLEILFSQLSEGVVAWDKTANTIECNQTAAEFHGLPNKSLPIEEWQQYYDVSPIQGSEAIRTEEILQHQVKQGQVVENQKITIVPKQGKTRTLLLNGNPIFNASGENLGAVLKMQDINSLQHDSVQTEIQKYFERLTLSLDAAKMGSWYWDSFTNKNIWTPYHDVIFGYGSGNGEHTYEDWASRVHPDDLPLAQAAWKDALYKHTDYVCEYRIVLPDNTVRWIESYGRYYYDDSGNALRMAGTVTDITERKKSEQALRESQRRYSTLARISPVGIYRCDGSANLLYVNQRWCDITGYNFDQVINQGWREAVYSQDKARVEAQVKNCVEQKIPLECEFRFQRPDNSVVWVLAQSVPEFDIDGVLIGHVGTITDISNQKQSEKALRASEERFRSTFEQAAVGICHADANGKFVRVNQKLCDILGYSRSELLERSFEEITYADDLQSDLDRVRDLLAGKIQNFSMEKRYICKNGGVIWIEITVSLVSQANGEQDYFLGVIKDISQRKEAQTQLLLRAQEQEELNVLLTQTATELRKRNCELDQFAYVASHDLKAPLRAIANLSQWLEDDLSEALEPENQRHLELLRQRVYRMEALIDGLLQYSRIGRVKNAEEKVDVNQLLAQIIDELAPESFNIKVKDNMPTLTTKSMLLRRVFINLIENAITHHNSACGNIEISVKDKGNCYEFCVSDDGSGISPQYHDKIFVIFQTLQARDKKESTGVGLSIVKKILETEGAKITVDSDVDKGASFCFTWHK